MNLQLSILDSRTRGTIQSLMPPSAKNMSLLHGFTLEPPQSPGHTYGLQSGEHVSAPGDGEVTGVQRKPNTFRHSAGLLDTDATWQITIHHGFNVYTAIQGMTTVNVQRGAPVVAGQDLGTPLTNEIFFQVMYPTTPYDPASISRYFRAYDGNKVVGKSGLVRQGPDIRVRAPESVIVRGTGDIQLFWLQG
jgi:murein DD-endopeptidase MepM/ murein hydrolase activator NlpD